MPEKVKTDSDLMYEAIAMLMYEQTGNVVFQEVDIELEQFEERWNNE